MAPLPPSACMTRAAALGAALLVLACTKSSSPPTPGGEARDASPSPSEAPSVARTPPPWPAAPDTPPPPGFSWRTVHHETVHARLLVPDGAKVELGRDGFDYPRVNVTVDKETVFVQFDSGAGQLGATMAKQPPTVYALPTQKAHVGPENLAARYRTHPGDLRIIGYAHGVKCDYEPKGAVPEATLARIYTVCASLRSPAPGAWRRATPEERAHGGMTDVPEGAWVEGALPKTPGSLLRPGEFVARLYMGGLAVNGSRCPPTMQILRELDPGEAEVAVEERQTAGGDVWIRRVTEEYQGDRYPGPTILFARRAGKCCKAVVVPWTKPASAEQIDYAIALCDTYRAE